MDVWGTKCAPTCVWRAENFVALVLSFRLFWDSGDRTLVMRVTPQVLYPLSHLLALWLVFWALLFETGFYCVPEVGLEFHRYRLGWLF